VNERATLGTFLTFRVETESGRHLGHVFELRCESRGEEPPVATAVLAGKGGLLRRVGVTRRAHEIPWDAVVSAGDGTIVVKDAAADH
jgi:hypothetical protein